jgi:DNA helicase-2/ATP-dependent DNA helicase PcrA
MDSAQSTLIIANPGTGKTTTLAKRVIELVESGVPEKEILCITFTTKATQEMRDRINEIAKSSGLNIKMHELAIHTFHSYALDYLESIEHEYKVLGNNILRFSIFKTFEKLHAFNYSRDYIVSEIVPKVENAIRYLKSFGILPNSIDIEKADKELEKIYNEEGISNITLEENMKFLEYFKKAYADYESSKPPGFIDYNDMLIGFIRKYDPKVRHYKHVLVDELQDVNKLEADIAIKSGDVLFLVGDRKQAIFGFQGGSVGNFKMFNSKNRQTLSKNYRSRQKILDYAKAHFLNNTHDNTYENELKSFGSGMDEGKVKVVVSDKPENIVTKIAMELSGKRAIITRTNGQLLNVSKILNSKGISYTSTISNATSESAKSVIIAFLKGLLYDDEDYVINALFTPFSGVTLREAFNAADKARKNEFKLENDAKPFFEIRSSIKNIKDIKTVFERRIIPICTSISMDYFVTAVTLIKNIEEYFDTSNDVNRGDLFNYLSVTEESYEPLGKESDLVLTTVHKAKGLEFENVIYMPKSTSEKFSFIDAVVYSIIKSVLGIDVREELEEEELRIDFVAFTRAKSSLFIVATPKLQGRYHIESISELESDAGEGEPEPISLKYDKAYSLFVAKRYDDAIKALSSKEAWLVDLINAYFPKVDKISYTLIESIKDPYAFFKNSILSLQERNTNMNLGSRIHEIAEMYFKRQLDEGKLSSDELLYLENIKKVNNELSKLGFSQKSSEEKLKIDISNIMPNYSGIMFIGKIDAVYENGNNYLIIDYKTDKSKDYEANHRKQLVAYKKLYSITNGIDGSMIKTAIAYIGLAGKINTGKLSHEIVFEKERSDTTLWKNFLKDVTLFMDYKNNPNLFIKDLIKGKSDELLFEIIKNELKA